MKSITKNEASYWKMQYDQLLKQKKLIYTNDSNEQLIKQLQQKCKKQEEQITKLNILVQNSSPTKLKNNEDELDLLKLQYKLKLEEKESLIISLQRDSLNIQTVALEHLKKSDIEIEQLKIKQISLNIKINEQIQLIQHLQTKLQQEQSETKDLKEKIIFLEKTNETLELTIDKQNTEIQNAKVKSKKEASQLLQKYRKYEQDYIELSTKIDNLIQNYFGKYANQQLENEQDNRIQKINSYINSLIEQNKNYQLQTKINDEQKLNIEKDLDQSKIKLQELEKQLSDIIQLREQENQKQKLLDINNEITEQDLSLEQTQDQ